MVKSPRRRTRGPHAARQSTDAQSAPPESRELLRRSTIQPPVTPPPRQAGDSRYFLLLVGLFIGGILAVAWELGVDDVKTPTTADAATGKNESKTSQRKTAKTHPPARSRRPTRRPQPAPPVAKHEKQNDDEQRRNNSTLYRPGPLTRSITPRDRYSAPDPAPSKTPDVCVDRVLVGGELIAAGLFDESTVEQEQDRSKYFVCFELSWAADSKLAYKSPNCQDFRLEDALGQEYEPLCDLKGLRPARPESGRSALRVVFAVFNDSAPERLLFRNADGEFVPLSE